MWLSKDVFEKLIGKSTKHDALVASILKVNEGMKADDVTPEFLEEALTASDNVKVDETLSAKVTELESKVETLNGTVASVTKERDDLKSENAELRLLPGSESVSTEKPRVEASAVQGNELVSFFKSKEGDTVAIAEKIVSEGLDKFVKLK
jgi:hypothetical protein